MNFCISMESDTLEFPFYSKGDKFFIHIYFMKDGKFVKDKFVSIECDEHQLDFEACPRLRITAEGLDNTGKRLSNSHKLLIDTHKGGYDE